MMRRNKGSLAALLLLGGCQGTVESSDEALLLLTIDTMRADRVGIGGDPRARTPWLDRVARAGTQYAVSLSPVPLTLPGHASILSGRVPPEHGARDNGTFRVPDDVPLVTESFAAAGWETAAFLAAFPLAARFGLRRGFDTYRDAPGTAFPQRPADEVNADVLAWLEGREPGSSPAFLWVHFFDPHTPYEPPRELARLEGRDLYRAEIAYTDRQATELARALDDSFDRVRVCVTADHGESLGDHGEGTHGVFVYEATTRVPLLFSGEGMEHALHLYPVSTTRIAATLLDWVGIDGTALFGTPLPGDGAAPLYLESMYPRLRHGWAPLRALRTERWKVIRAPEPEVYDLLADPGELHNVHEERRGVPEVRELLEEVADVRWDGRAEAEEADVEVTAALESLGYVAPIRVDTTPDEERPDPKHRVRLDALLGQSALALEAGDLRVARTFLSRALSVEPRNKETMVVRARIEAASGNFDRAFDTFARCLELAPEELDSVVHYEAGRVALTAARLDRAEESFALAVRADPLNVDALFNWGVAAYRDGRFSDAAARWRRALELDPTHPPSLEWLPEVEARIGEAPGS